MSNAANTIRVDDRALTSNRSEPDLDAPSLALAEVIGASLDLTETLKATGAALRATTGADRALIYLYDAERDTLRQIVTTSDRIDWDEIVTLRGRSVGEIPLWLAVQNSPGGVLELPDTVDLRALDPDRATRTGMHAVLGLRLHHPSVASRGPLGIAFCTWDDPQQAFDPQVVRAARSIAAQAAVAVANARNHAQGELLVKHLSALASFAARLTSAGSPAQVKARSARAAASLLESPLVAHWSPGEVVWYPAPPRHGEDEEALLALLTTGEERLRVVRAEETPPQIADALRARGLEYALLAMPNARGSLLFVAFAPRPDAVAEKVASLLADLTGSALHTAEAHAKVAHLALSDPLTDVGNRRAFERGLAEALALAVRTDRPMSLCLMDLDNFRRFNETGGHQLGDEALRVVADTLRAAMRTSDQAFRLGGDEFALILPDTDAASAVSVLQRVLAMLRTSRVGVLSITAGLAESPRHGDRPHLLYKAADDALYSGKRAGRARVSLATT